MTEAKAIVINGNGYYVSSLGRRFSTEEQAILSEILGDEIDEKFKMAKSLKSHQHMSANKLANYEKSNRKDGVDSIEKVFQELHKRLSLNSQQILSSYRVPDYTNYTRNAETEISMRLDPDCLMPSKQLDFKKTDYFKCKDDFKKFDNKVEQEAKEKIEQLVEKFPKVKTNTALLQYAHTLSKELLKNKYLKEKHEEFLCKQQQTEVSKQDRAISNIKSGQDACGLNISLKHQYNKKFVPNETHLSMTQHAEEANEAPQTTSDAKSRVASLYVSDSKCGTVKIGPARQSLVEATAANVARLGTESVVSANMASSEGLVSNSTGGSMVKPNLRISMRSVDRNWNYNQNYARNRYTHAGPLSANSTGSIDSAFSQKQRVHSNSKVIRYSQICIANEKKEKFANASATAALPNLEESISFIKTKVTNYDPLSSLNTPTTPVSAGLPFARSSKQIHQIITSTPITAQTPTSLVTPISTISSSLSLNQNTGSSNCSSTQSETSEPEDRELKKSPTKVRSKLSNVINPEDAFEDLKPCSIETATSPEAAEKSDTLSSAPVAPVSALVVPIPKSALDKIATKAALEPIIEVNSIMEGRKSITSRISDDAAMERKMSQCSKQCKVPESVLEESEEALESESEDEKSVKSKKSEKSVHSTKDAAPVENQPQLEEIAPIKPKSKKFAGMFSRKPKKPSKLSQSVCSEKGEEDEYADVNSYDSLIDLLSVQSIAGTIEHKDFVEAKDKSTRSSKTTIKKNNALGIVMEEPESDEDSDFSRTHSSPGSSSSISEFSDSENNEYFMSPPIPLKIAKKPVVDDYQKELLKSQLERELKRNKMLSCLTEYDVFKDEDIKLVFDDKKFNQDFVTFNRKRESFDIFETYLLALARLKVSE